jgi:hypothetical protein
MARFFLDAIFGGVRLFLGVILGGCLKLKGGRFKSVSVIGNTKESGFWPEIQKDRKFAGAYTIQISGVLCGGKSAMLGVLRIEGVLRTS